MIKIGIFGTGHIGKFHLNNWVEMEDVEVVGFFEPADAIAEEVEKKYHLKRYATPEELFAICDAVDIATPTNYHFDIAESAIRAGKHVFIEKPIVKTLEQGRRLINMVREAGIKMQVGHIERFNPAYLAAKSMITQPLFIEVHRLSQFNPRGTEVSVILDLMIHDIDLILSLVKSGVRNIAASGVGVITHTPDIASVRIEFDNGCVANLTSSRISMKKMRKMRIFQKDAYIGMDFLEKKTEVIKIKEEHDSNTFNFDIDVPGGGTKTIALATPKVAPSNAMKDELQAFVDSIKYNKPTIVNEIDGFLALEVAYQILEKINNNHILVKD